MSKNFIKSRRKSRFCQVGISFLVNGAQEVFEGVDLLVVLLPEEGVYL